MQDCGCKAKARACPRRPTPIHKHTHTGVPAPQGHARPALPASAIAFHHDRQRTTHLPVGNLLVFGGKGGAGLVCCFARGAVLGGAVGAFARRACLGRASLRVDTPGTITGGAA